MTLRGYVADLDRKIKYMPINVTIKKKLVEHNKGFFITGTIKKSQGQIEKITFSISQKVQSQPSLTLNSLKEREKSKRLEHVR